MSSPRCSPIRRPRRPHARPHVRRHWVTGTGADGAPRARCTCTTCPTTPRRWREHGAQAVVWQTAINPVVALEMLADRRVARRGRARPRGVRRGAVPRPPRAPRRGARNGRGRPETLEADGGDVLRRDPDLQARLLGLPRYGYSSLPRYFFASLSICGSAPSVVQLRAAVDRDPLVRSSFGSTTVSATRESCSRCVGFARPVAVLNDGGAVVDVDPDDGVVRRAVLAERRDDAHEGLLQELRAGRRSALPWASLFVGRAYLCDNGGRPRSLPAISGSAHAADLW